MFSIYILHSITADKYYIGYSPDPNKRLEEHNSYTNKTKFTARYQPWILMAHFQVSSSVGDAMRIERFIKKQKSRRFIESIIENHNDREFVTSIIKRATGQSGPETSGLIRRFPKSGTWGAKPSK